MTNTNKLLCILLFTISNLQLYANMASPTMRGSITSEAYSSKHIDILHEQITIKHIDPYQAKFTIIYTIKSDSSGRVIPLIFDTKTNDYGEGGDVKVWIDNIEIQVSNVPSTYEDKNALIWFDSLDNHISYPIENSPNFIGYKYFEVDLSKGIHTIRVEYTALASVNTSEITRSFNYVYNLAPARYWRSFGSLDIEIDTTPLDGQYLINITTKTDTITNGTISYWHFTELPSDEINITFFPRFSKFSQILISIGSGGFTFIFIIAFIFFHIRFTLKYRTANPEKKYSPVVIAGSLILPFLFISSYIFFSFFLDWIIGEFASNRHAYIFIIYIFYPISVAIYWPVMWLIDKYKKQRLLQNKKCSK